jgi:DNA-binding transcriptional LysR family regulator
VASGLGYALVPAYATRLAMAGVVFVALREALDSVPLTLVWNDARASSQLAALRERVDLAFPQGRAARSRKQR